MDINRLLHYLNENQKFRLKLKGDAALHIFKTDDVREAQTGGSVITAKIKCPNCGFWSSNSIDGRNDQFVMTRLISHMKSGNCVTPTDNYNDVHSNGSIIVSSSVTTLSTNQEDDSEDSSSLNGVPAVQRKAKSEPVRNEKCVKRSALRNVTNAQTEIIDSSSCESEYDSNSSMRNGKGVKRSALGNITNTKHARNDAKKAAPVKSNETGAAVAKREKKTEATAYRSSLVDWMVNSEYKCELNPEILCFAVRIVDNYLNKVQIEEENLQLLGALALLMSYVRHEKAPPLSFEVFFGSFKPENMIGIIKGALRICDDVGAPLPYRFLSGFASCDDVTETDLTLARFILGLSFMSYELITSQDSKIAAASLYMARRMNNKTGWNETLENCSGYKLSDFETIIPLLNGLLQTSSSFKMPMPLTHFE